ncbi:LysR family transcriptional regulator, partial [Pseudomonas sp. SIMBA_064]
TGSVSAAAQLLHVSQPAVTKVLQHAELQLGFPLFLRGWGDPMLPQFTHVVFLRLDTETRLHRLRLREMQRYGDEVLEGGNRHA